MASVNNGGEDDTHHLFEHDPVFNEGPWDVHRVSKMDVVIRGAVHLQTKDGDVDDDDVGFDDDDDVMMHSAGALALAPLGGSLPAEQCKVRTKVSLYCAICKMYNIQHLLV